MDTIYKPHVQRGIPDDLFTDDIRGVRRIAVDPQQTSFEKNFQFGFFDRLFQIPTTSQIVYKVTVGRDSVLFTRDINLWSGARELLIYPDSAQINFTGTLQTTGKQRLLNRIKNEIYTALPSPEITFQRAIGNSIITTGTEVPLNGGIVATASQTVARASEYNQFGTRIGWPIGTVLWYVYNQIATNNDATSGHIEFNWEQR